MKTHVLEAEKFVAGDRTGWDAAMKEFGVARRYAETLDERKPIHDRSGWCELNQRDEKALQDAENIVKNGEEKRYPEAKALLEGISPNGRYAKQAQDALEWFQADDLVRAAINAYHSGNWEEACTLVDKAVASPNLNPQAVEQVKRRRAHWEAVHDAWAKGAAAEQAGDFKGARELYKFVVAQRTLEQERLPHARPRRDRHDRRAREGRDRRGLEAGPRPPRGRQAPQRVRQVRLRRRARPRGFAGARPDRGNCVAHANKAKGLFEANKLRHQQEGQVRVGPGHTERPLPLPAGGRPRPRRRGAAPPEGEVMGTLTMSPALVRESDGRVVASNLEVADSFLSRFLGLMGRAALPAGGALWIEPCSSIHMMFMRFRIDAVFVDAEGRVLKVSPRVLPWLGLTWCSGAAAVVELEAGAAGRASLSPGDRLLRGGAA